MNPNVSEYSFLRILENGVSSGACAYREIVAYVGEALCVHIAFNIAMTGQVFLSIRTSDSRLFPCAGEEQNKQ